MIATATTSDRDYNRVERAIRYIAKDRLAQPSLEDVRGRGRGRPCA